MLLVQPGPVHQSVDVKSKLDDSRISLSHDNLRRDGFFWYILDSTADGCRLDTV